MNQKIHDKSRLRKTLTSNPQSSLVSDDYSLVASISSWLRSYNADAFKPLLNALKLLQLEHDSLIPFLSSLTRFFHEPPFDLSASRYGEFQKITSRMESEGHSVTTFVNLMIANIESLLTTAATASPIAFPNPLEDLKTILSDHMRHEMTDLFRGVPDNLRHHLKVLSPVHGLFVLSPFYHSSWGKVLLSIASGYVASTPPETFENLFRMHIILDWCKSHDPVHCIENLHRIVVNTCSNNPTFKARVIDATQLHSLIAFIIKIGCPALAAISASSACPIFQEYRNSPLDYQLRAAQQWNSDAFSSYIRTEIARFVKETKIPLSGHAREFARHFSLTQASGSPNDDANRDSSSSGGREQGNSFAISVNSHTSTTTHGNSNQMSHNSLYLHANQAHDVGNPITHPGMSSSPEWTNFPTSAARVGDTATNSDPRLVQGGAGLQQGGLPLHQSVHSAHNAQSVMPNHVSYNPHIQMQSLPLNRLADTSTPNVMHAHHVMQQPEFSMNPYSSQQLVHETRVLAQMEHNVDGQVYANNQRNSSSDTVRNCHNVYLSNDSYNSQHLRENGAFLTPNDTTNVNHFTSNMPSQTQNLTHSGRQGDFYVENVSSNQNHVHYVQYEIDNANNQILPHYHSSDRQTISMQNQQQAWNNSDASALGSSTMYSNAYFGNSVVNPNSHTFHSQNTTNTTQSHIISPEDPNTRQLPPLNTSLTQQQRSQHHIDALRVVDMPFASQMHATSTNMAPHMHATSTNMAPHMHTTSTNMAPHMHASSANVRSLNHYTSAPLTQTYGATSPVESGVTERMPDQSSNGSDRTLPMTVSYTSSVVMSPAVSTAHRRNASTVSLGNNSGNIKMPTQNFSNSTNPMNVTRNMARSVDATGPYHSLELIRGVRQPFNGNDRQTMSHRSERMENWKCYTQNDSSTTSLTHSISGVSFSAISSEQGSRISQSSGFPEMDGSPLLIAAKQSDVHVAENVHKGRHQQYYDEDRLSGVLSEQRYSTNSLSLNTPADGIYNIERAWQKESCRQTFHILPTQMFPVANNASLASPSTLIDSALQDSHISVAPPKMDTSTSNNAQQPSGLKTVLSTSLFTQDVDPHRQSSSSSASSASSASPLLAPAGYQRVSQNGSGSDNPDSGSESTKQSHGHRGSAQGRDSGEISGDGKQDLYAGTIPNLVGPDSWLSTAWSTVDNSFGKYAGTNLNTDVFNFTGLASDSALASYTAASMSLQNINNICSANKLSGTSPTTNKPSLMFDNIDFSKLSSKLPPCAVAPSPQEQLQLSNPFPSGKLDGVPNMYFPTQSQTAQFVYEANSTAISSGPSIKSLSTDSSLNNVANAATYTHQQSSSTDMYQVHGHQMHGQMNPTPAPAPSPSCSITTSTSSANAGSNRGFNTTPINMNAPANSQMQYPNAQMPYTVNPRVPNLFLAVDHSPMMNSHHLTSATCGSAPSPLSNNFTTNPHMQYSANSPLAANFQQINLAPSPLNVSSPHGSQHSERAILALSTRSVSSPSQNHFTNFVANNPSTVSFIASFPDEVPASPSGTWDKHEREYLRCSERSSGSSNRISGFTRVSERTDVSSQVSFALSSSPFLCSSTLSRCVSSPVSHPAHNGPNDVGIPPNQLTNHVAKKSVNNQVANNTAPSKKAYQKSSQKTDAGPVVGHATLRIMLHLAAIHDWELRKVTVANSGITFSSNPTASNTTCKLAPSLSSASGCSDGSSTSLSSTTSHSFDILRTSFANTAGTTDYPTGSPSDSSYHAIASGVRTSPEAVTNSIQTSPLCLGISENDASHMEHVRISENSTGKDTTSLPTIREAERYPTIRTASHKLPNSATSHTPTVPTIPIINAKTPTQPLTAGKFIVEPAHRAPSSADGNDAVDAAEGHDGETSKATQAQYEFHAKLSQQMEKLGLLQSATDRCLFVSSGDNPSKVYACVWMDQILLSGPCPDDVDALIAKLGEIYDITVDKEVKKFVKQQITRHRSQRLLKISLHDYVETLAAKHLPSDMTTYESIPMAPGVFLTPPTHREPPCRRPYRSLVRSLLYVGNICRPDICFAANQLAQHMNRYTEEHWKVAVNVLSYLKSTSAYGVWLGGEQGNNHELRMDYDVIWRKKPYEKLSVTGRLCLLGSSPLTWTAKRIASVANNNTIAHFISMTQAHEDLMEISRLVQDFHLPVSTPVMCYGHSQFITEISQLTPPRVENSEIDEKIAKLSTMIHSKQVQMKFVEAHELSSLGLIDTLAGQQFIQNRSSMRVSADTFM